VDDPGGAVKWGGMNEQLAVSVGEGTAGPAAAGSAVAPVVAVFVDATGRRRRLMTGLGWLVALSCVAYLAVIGFSMTGTSVGPLPEVPNVAPRMVVFGPDLAALPLGALEFPLPVVAVPVLAKAPQLRAGVGRAAGSSRGGARPSRTARARWAVPGLTPGARAKGTTR
jgi:hypothetical protein